MRPLKKDPAPSRIRYRLQRLWLTPSFRSFLRIGPILAILAVIAHWAITDPRVYGFFSTQITQAHNSFTSREEFRLTAITIHGAGEELSFDVREAADLALPVSSFDVDLDAIKERIVAIAAVREARVKVIKGGVLDIAVTERLPAILWRTEVGLQLLDREGVVLGPVDRRIDRIDLPLIAGIGADGYVAEALALFRAAQPLEERIRGLVRVGERRWDVILDRGQHILLPSTDAVQAFERVIGLHAAEDILSRDVARVDIRNPERPTLSLNQNANDELIRLRLLAKGEVPLE